MVSRLAKEHGNSSTSKSKIQKPLDDTPENISASYNKFKEFAGKQYTGMKVGRSHKWYYDKGEWKDEA